MEKEKKKKEFKFFRKRIVFDKAEAKDLWISGWCWRALGEKYNCHALTVKKGIKGLLDEDRERHNASHSFDCPLCRIYPTARLF